MKQTKDFKQRSKHMQSQNKISLLINETISGSLHFSRSPGCIFIARWDNLLLKMTQMRNLKIPSNNKINESEEMSFKLFFNYLVTATSISYTTCSRAVSHSRMSDRHCHRRRVHLFSVRNSKMTALEVRSSRTKSLVTCSTSGGWRASGATQQLERSNENS